MLAPRLALALALASLLVSGCVVDDPLPAPADTTDHRVDATLADMHARYEAFLASCDHKGLFTIAYLRTTEQYKLAAEDPAFFHDPKYLADEDRLFASYWFDHVDAWTSGRKGDVPPAWTLAFASSDAHAVSTLGDALLGISAHINQDLPYVIATLGTTDASGASRKPDHDKVNDFLAKVSFNADVTARWDPTFDADYSTGLPIIEGWREDAWNAALRLVAATTPEARKAVDDDIEKNALHVGQGIANLTAYAKGDSSAARDAFCRQHP